MKKLLFLFVTFLVYINCGAQVLDTISLEKFKTLKHKQIKTLYAADEDALDLIKKSHTRKINAYVFFGLSVPFAVTLNPAIWMPLTPAVVKLSNNTKKSLYNKLLYFERVKYNKDTIKTAITTDTSSYKYKYASYVFDITLEEFKALGKEKQLALFNINDTTQYIFDYTNNYNHTKYGRYLLSGISILIGANFLGVGVASYIFKGYEYQIPMIFGTGIGTAFIVTGIYLLPTKDYIKKMDSQRILYNNLQQYYLVHKVYPELAKYIKNRREHYKPKPLIN